MNFFSGANQAQVSQPPHLTSSWSSAFIPFCAYKTNLNFSGKSPSLAGTTFPLCSSFLPTILEGQLCYELKLNNTSDQGKRNELLLILDYNEEFSIQTSSSEKERKNQTTIGNETLNLDTTFESIESEDAKIKVNTLSNNINFGGGTYILSAVKKMAGTADFLKMPVEKRKCDIELYEDCRTRKLLDKCHCVPWEVASFQVGADILFQT